MHDVLIKGGTVIDGSGKPGFTADVAIANGRITEVGRIDTPARRTVPADGLLVTPGWVDIHTHYDGQATWDAFMTPSSWHGVTTAIMGNWRRLRPLTGPPTSMDDGLDGRRGGYSWSGAVRRCSVGMGKFS